MRRARRVCAARARGRRTVRGERAGRVRHQASRRTASGARPSTGGKKPSRSTRPTRRRSTTWRSPTSTRATSTRRARRTRRRSSSTRTTCRFGRTTICSRKSMTARAPPRQSLASPSPRRGRCWRRWRRPAAELLRDPDRNADPAEDGRLGVPARAGRRFRRRRHRGRRREPGDRAAAAQPAAHEVVAAGDRRRRHAARRTSRQEQAKARATRRHRRLAPPTASSHRSAQADARRCPRSRTRRTSSRTKALRERRVLEEHRRGIPEPAHRHRHGAVHAAARRPASSSASRRSSTRSAAAASSRPHVQERKGFILRPKFVFIDGRTGATLYSESFREEILYNAQQNTPALSSYFELMDRLLPSFLNTLSARRSGAPGCSLK